MINVIKNSAIALLATACNVAGENQLCEVKGENLIKDPYFSVQKDGGGLAHWLSTQHGGENSYKYSTENGEFTVERVGEQPGFLFRQRVDIVKSEENKLAFYAELEFDLSVSPATLRLSPPGGGLAFTAWSGKGGRGKPLLDASLLNEPKLGKLEWHPVQIVVSIPQETRSVEVGFRLEANGVLKARNPRLQIVDESVNTCAITPGANFFEVKKSTLR